MVCRTVNQIGMSCSRRNVSRVDSRWRPATGGSRRSTITTTVTASTARSAKRTSKDRASSQREDDPSARRTPAKCMCGHVMYNSDTVYSTTTFRPVSPLPRSPASSSPQRTRKLETPLHMAGGLFSDIRSADGKLLTTLTVDRVHCASRCDVTDHPARYESVSAHGKDYVDDILKTETVTNEEVIKVKFTPVALELGAAPRLRTPSQFRERPASPVPYISDGYADLQSYKIVNSVCKEKLFERSELSKSFDSLDVTDSIGRSPSPLAVYLATEPVTSSPSPLASFLSSESVKRSSSPLASFLTSEPIQRSPSPLANFLVSEQMTKIDHYLQESLDACTGGGRESRATPLLRVDGETLQEVKETQKLQESKLNSSAINSNYTSGYRNENVTNYETRSYAPTEVSPVKEFKKSRVNSVKEKEPGVLRAIYNMPVHYHAIILCFFLIVYNLIYQYVKENCHGKK